MVLLAACRPQAAAVLPTAIPTLTSIPRSTPLPPLPTSVPAGSKDNPIHLVIHPAKDVSTNSSLSTDLEAAIEKKTGLMVKLDLVESDAKALTSLCHSGQPALAWLSAIGYGVANARNCGQPQLFVSRGTGTDAKTGDIITVIARRGIDSLTALKGRVFCRISNTDFASWIAPSLMMQSAGMNPEQDLKTIKEFTEPADMVSAVASSQCDAAAILDSEVKPLVEDNKTVAPKVSTLVSSVEFPYAVLVASSNIPLSAITSISDELVVIAKDRQLKSSLNTLLGQTTLISVKPDDLQPFVDFMGSTRQDFAQLGS